MKFESTPEHVGSGKPLESATEAVKRIAESMAENEEALREAKRAGDAERVKTIQAEQEELLEERRKILQGTAKDRDYPLAG